MDALVNRNRQRPTPPRPAWRRLADFLARQGCFDDRVARLQIQGPRLARDPRGQTESGR